MEDRLEELFGWKPIEGEGTCDGCSEHQPLRYEWPEAEAWLCAECWHDATEIDRLRAEVESLRARLTEAEAENEHLRDRVKHNPFCSAAGWPCPIGCEKWASLDTITDNNDLRARVARLTEAADNAVHEWAFIGHGESFESAMGALAAVLAEVGP